MVSTESDERYRFVCPRFDDTSEDIECRHSMKSLDTDAPKQLLSGETYQHYQFKHGKAESADRFYRLSVRSVPSLGCSKPATGVVRRIHSARRHLSTLMYHIQK